MKSRLPLAPQDNGHKYLSVVRNNAVVLSLQGEGTRVGVPSVFLRTFGCNRKCTWCDEKDTWTKAPLEMSVHVENLAGDIVKHGFHDLVITGGEPTLQAKSLVELLRSLPQVGYEHVTLETNGSIFDEELATLVSLPSLSPKIDDILARGSIKPSQSELDWYTYAMWTRVPVQVKIVVAKPADVEVAVAYFKYVVRKGYVAQDHCIIQPEWAKFGVSAKPFMRSLLSSGFRFLPQMHKMWQVR